MGSDGWKTFHWRVKRLFIRGLRLGPILCSLALLGTACVAVGGPPSPPPAGQVWVESGGQWVLVPVPPSEGPYRWVGNGWVPDPTPPPPGSEWVPGHWAGGPAGRAWIPGHRGPRGGWIPGHWR